MDTTWVYATVLAGIALSLVLLNTIPYFLKAFEIMRHLTIPHLLRALKIMRNLTYVDVLNRHALIGPWSAVSLLFQSLYVMVNVFCLSFKVNNLSHAGRRAGTLSLINLGPLLGSLNLDFLAGILRLSLKSTQRIHRSAGIVSFILAIFHVAVAAATENSAFLRESSHVFTIIAGSTLCFLSVASRIAQKASYKIFLLTHVLLASLFLYSVWTHLPAQNVFPRLFVYVFMGIFGATFTIESVIILKRNGVFRWRRSRATITCSAGVVHLKLYLSKSLNIKPGQHINIWIPSVSAGAWLQIHPFVVTSWTAEPQSTLDLFVQPRGGFTKNLLRIASRGKRAEDKWVLFSGPHGQTVPAGEYDRVLLVADGAGIAALLPYLKRLIHGYHAGQVSTRKIHLVWQISDIEISIAAQPFLNKALTEDQLKSGRILRISIYVDRDEIPEESFGERSTVYPGVADLESIVAKELLLDGELQATVPTQATENRSHGDSLRSQSVTRLEVRSTHHTTVDEEGIALTRLSAVSEYSTDDLGIADQTNPPMDNETAPNSPVWEGKEELRPPSDGKMLVLASTLAKTRDALRKAARTHSQNNMDLVEVDFQPFKGN